jgi:hypothetical protein
MLCLSKWHELSYNRLSGLDLGRKYEIRPQRPISSWCLWTRVTSDLVLVCVKVWAFFVIQKSLHTALS